MTHAGKTWKLAIVQPEGRFKPPVWLQTSLDRNSASFSSGVQNLKTQTLQWTTQTCVGDAHAIEPQARTKKVSFHAERKTAQNGNHLTILSENGNNPQPHLCEWAPQQIGQPTGQKRNPPAQANVRNPPQGSDPRPATLCDFCLNGMGLLPVRWLPGLGTFGGNRKWCSFGFNQEKLQRVPSEQTHIA